MVLGLKVDKVADMKVDKVAGMGVEVDRNTATFPTLYIVVRTVLSSAPMWKCF